MGLADIVRSGIALADTLTSSLQSTVKFEAWIGNKGGYPGGKYAEPVELPAIVESMHRLIRLDDGRTVVQRAKVTILKPLSANGATNRREPIDPRDRITLQDGTTGPILDVVGLVDPSTGRPYMHEISLGHTL